MLNTMYLHIADCGLQDHSDDFLQKLEAIARHLADHWESYRGNNVYITFLATGLQFEEERPLNFTETAGITAQRNLYTQKVTYSPAFSGTLGENIASETLTKIEGKKSRTNGGHSPNDGSGSEMGFESQPTAMSKSLLSGTFEQEETVPQLTGSLGSGGSHDSFFTL